jgi:hypothetical protein
MISKDQVDRIVDAIESVSMELSGDIITKASVDDYNNIAYIGEQLARIATVLENWEERTRA